MTLWLIGVILWLIVGDVVADRDDFVADSG